MSDADIDGDETTLAHTRSARALYVFAAALVALSVGAAFLLWRRWGADVFLEMAQSFWRACF